MSARYNRFILPTVAIAGMGEARCSACDAPLGAAGAGWKSGAVWREVALADMPAGAYDTGHPGVVLREYCCPACSALLEVETAERGEPALADRLADA